MTPISIKSKIAAAGTTQTAIAEYLGVKPGSVAKVVHGQMRSARIEAELAKIVGGPIFHGEPRKPGRPKSTWNGHIQQVTA